MKITIYTDGAARGNPGKGGWGVVILFDRENKNKILKFGGWSKYATNNQMELTAVIESLKYITKNKQELQTCEQLGQESRAREIKIYSDSKYVINGIKFWIHNWKKNNWLTVAKKPVLNKNLWEELYKLTEIINQKTNQKTNIMWQYVPSHSGHKWNEMADKIATNFADLQKNVA